ncbi:hypothetical protein OUZ56_018411 [Daphnia magna]|uniref:Tc1-like transposase DDE domain-containing protein n=1 Tax=Daphnia magna TaxID=35525 RepID=A0ABQ9Z9W3_9CRUS|nr:hypothetical protein OUZ56_018411 [Daphnia magna]
MLQLRRERKHSIEFWTEKEEANTVLVWCMISSFAQKSALCRVNGKFDSNNYKNILRQYVLPLSLNERIGLVFDWYPVHRSQSVNEFLAEHKRNIFVVDLPKSFGDIMPLEQLWLEISIKFTEENVKASSMCGLKREITSMWSKVCTDEFIKQLFEEIPVKLQQVVTNRGSQYVD